VPRGRQPLASEVLERANPVGVGGGGVIVERKPLHGRARPDVEKVWTIDGRYASGKAFTERYAADGRLSYTEPGLALGGHWSVTEGTLCTIYDYDATGGCYRVARVDANCYEFYFVSRTEAAAPGPPGGGKPSWTARGALQGKPSACRDAPSV